MDWSRCQSATSESLRCSQKRGNINARCVYEAFLNNVDGFKQLQASPLSLEYGDHGTPEAFIKNGASWHHSCHLKFNNTKLERLRKHQVKENIDTKERSSKRQKVASPSRNNCIFCKKDTFQKLHEYSKVSLTKILRRMATEMNDFDLLATISNGDLVAIAAKYHMDCLTQFRNRYRKHQSNTLSFSKTERDRVKGRVFAELVSYVEGLVEEGTLNPSTTFRNVVWDRYISSSIKESTREKRGKGVRLKVEPKTKTPVKWKDFLLNSKNKEELFLYLSELVEQQSFTDNKNVYITKGTSVISKGNNMSNSTQEEADTRIVIHLVHSLEHGARQIMVRTVDTDIIIILIGQFFNLCHRFPELKLWVAFGTGNHFCYYNINNMCRHLGESMACALPLFHAFSGCDTTSSFFGKSKKSAWKAWKSFPEATEAFLSMYRHPFQQVDCLSLNFKHIERLTILLYNKSSISLSVNEARRNMFSQKNKDIAHVPPTQVIKIDYVKRAIYQGGIWTTCQNAEPTIPTPEDWGWTLEDTHWKPVWMTKPEAAKACNELIKCGCKSDRGCVTCKCAKSNLPCTELCSCKCPR
ncbi:uncharacterized protein [Antedon mediterranea]|uniref:uncharacterized protein n=1 Tax=Antedon mediterranea TaxID=105859 RepID=UPI003AF57697